jgi:hypothetical protein
MNYTNTTVRSNQSTQEYALGLTTNYAIVKDEPNEVRLDNRTADIDQQELISYRVKKISTVNSGLNIQHPALEKGGVQYAVQIEETVREIAPDGTYWDRPVVMYLTIRHPLSGAVTNNVLAETFERLLSSIRKESDNSYRFVDLMRGALRPQQD